MFEIDLFLRILYNWGGFS